jgi:WD40-like Beta Propeller Repeat
MRYAAIVPAFAVPTLLAMTGCDPDSTVRPIAPRLDRSSSFSEWSQPVSLGPLINTSFGEQQPTLSRDGLTLYFASNRPTDPGDEVDYNIWVAQRTCTDTADAACVWKAPAVLGAAINGPYFDITPALSRDEHYLFYSSQRARDNCSSAPCDRDLWVSYRDDVHDDFAWQEPVNLGAGVNGPGEDLAPSYFANEDEGLPQLYFTRGLLADADLYVSQMQTDGSWGPASPIAELNMPGITEARPSLTANGLEIYFGSTRSGTLRIWHASRASLIDAWSDVALVPSPIADAVSQQPFIHSHGHTESLYIVRSFDIFVSQRTRGQREDTP